MDKSKEILEIFILSYNRRAYLERCLKSVLEQTDEYIKVIVIDNKSTDGTIELLEEYRHRGIEFIINEKNLGGIGSIRKAQKLSTAQWVMIFHDDDMLHPQFVEQARRFFDRNEVALIVSYGNRTLTPENVIFRKLEAEISYKSFNSSEFTGELLKAKLIPFCSAVYRHDFLGVAEFNEDTYGKVGDRPFLLDVAKCGDTVLLKEKLVLTRIHKDNDSRSEDGTIKSCQWISLVRRLRKEAKKQKGGVGDISFMIRGRKHLMMPIESQIIRKGERRIYLEQAYRVNAISKKEMIIGMPYHCVYAILRNIYRYFINLKLRRL